MGPSALNPFSKRSAAVRRPLPRSPVTMSAPKVPELAGGVLPLPARRHESVLRAGRQVSVRDQAHLDEVVAVVKDLRMRDVGDRMILHVDGGSGMRTLS